MSILEVRDLYIQYLTRKGAAKAVDGISFSVEKNTTLGLIGESGCGKTTTAMAIMRFIMPPGKIMGGKIIFEGNDIVKIPEEKIRNLRGEKLTIVRQEAQNALNPVMNIGDQIAEVILEHENISKRDAWERAKQQLDLVGIIHKRVKSYPHELSGGMRQRVMIAIATACNPDFLILDEPITGLDVIVQRQLLILINNLREKLNLTATFIAHDLSVISETCDNVVVMYAGKIMEKASKMDLFNNPMHPYSKALIKAYPSIRGEKKELMSIPGVPPSLIDPPRGCRFNPRCKYATHICREEEPEIREVNGHSVACHLIK
ncbi:MAG: ABC transporter ATP-binding protein [Spirochaetes bacterium]|nr:MAG: ABC transporter ATP-binding protein [Spirochaetota bacterium]